MLLVRSGASGTAAGRSYVPNCLDVRLQMAFELEDYLLSDLRKL